MAEAIAMKANTEAEKVVLRAVIKRGDAGMKYYECPCGWFYSGARCPDKTCVKWKKENGTKRIKLYAHESSEGWYDDGKKMGLEGDALRNFAHWGEEIEF